MISGVAWYKPNQWKKLLHYAADSEDLEKTYLEWKHNAESAIRQMQIMGITIIKVDVDVEEIREWCRKKGHPLDSRARSEFVSEKLREKHDQDNP